MNVTRREMQTRRVEYVVPVPCHGSDLSDALHMALNDLRDIGAMICDDTISVSVTDDAIVLSFPIRADEAPWLIDGNQPTTVYGDPDDRSTWTPAGSGWLILPSEMKGMKR